MFPGVATKQLSPLSPTQKRELFGSRFFFIWIIGWQMIYSKFMPKVFHRLKAFIKQIVKTPLRITLFILMVITGSILIMVFINQWLIASTRSAIYTDINKVPINDVGLVLGTSKVLPGGLLNLHFKYRIEAAAELYRQGKVKHLIVSGDNHIKEYDEPTQMKQDLIELGVPAEDITPDYAGFRTLDSLARAKAIFGQTKLTVITDDFHAARSVFLGRAFNIDTVAFCSKSIPYEYSANSRVREYSARVKAILDIYILGTNAKYLGDKVEIKITQKSS